MSKPTILRKIDPDWNIETGGSGDDPGCVRATRPGWGSMIWIIEIKGAAWIDTIPSVVIPRQVCDALWEEYDKMKGIPNDRTSLVRDFRTLASVRRLVDRVREGKLTLVQLLSKLDKLLPS
jgi:hypothetical protein